VGIKKIDKGDNIMLKETFPIAVPTVFFEDEFVNIQGTIDDIRNLYKQRLFFSLDLLVSSIVSEP
jgi:hypothetical protein